ncbi:hypothetical protein [Bradyrhizobium septentrionale]|uniref:Uncharacterized protein n=1 Tax=Bradyrhizobium septentrionale TaxID=1404411 RepID=A0ABZ2P8E4_9BRAD
MTLFFKSDPAPSMPSGQLAEANEYLVNRRSLMSALSTFAVALPLALMPSANRAAAAEVPLPRRRHVEEAHRLGEAYRRSQQEKIVAEYDALYPGFADITRRAADLEKITPQMVPLPDGSGRTASRDPRWLALLDDARKVIEASSRELA